MKCAEHLTRNLGLWLTNDEGFYRRYSDLAKECYVDARDDDDDTVEDCKRIATLNLADAIEEECNELLTEGLEGIPLDLLTVALAHIDWKDLAEYYTADMCDDD